VQKLTSIIRSIFLKAGMRLDQSVYVGHAQTYTIMTVGCAKYGKFHAIGQYQLMANERLTSGYG
jgi:hypothetical protein